jgi:hypothetical protein
VFWHLINKTDLVCLTDYENYIPLTYFVGNNITDKEYNSSGALSAEPFPGTKLWATYYDSDKSSINGFDLSNMTLLTVFDPKHGRKAKKYLYPLILKVLSEAHKKIK